MTKKAFHYGDISSLLLNKKYFYSFSFQTSQVSTNAQPTIAIQM